MKGGLPRLEKIALIRRMAEECDAKRRQRIPLDPCPPSPEPDEEQRKRSLELRCRANDILACAFCEHHGAQNAAVRDEMLREVVELCTASIEADSTVPYAVINRALCKLMLCVYDEAEVDADWAEQIIRNGPQPLGQDLTRSLANAIYYGASAKLEAGRYEDGHLDLHAAQDLVADDERVNKKLGIVHGVLDELKEKYGSNIRAQQIARIHEYNGYGLTHYELGLLDEAGLPPWYGFVKHILKVVNALETEVPSKKSRAHHETTQCHNCWATQSETKLFFCAKCRAAKYCSKECQRAAWKDHKAHCKVAAASREKLESLTEKIQPFSFASNAKDLPDSVAEMVSLLQAWTNKHRPLLVSSLINALDLQSNPEAHLTKSLAVVVDWVARDTATAQRFRISSALFVDIASLPRIDVDGILNTRKNLDAAHRKRGGYGVAMLLIMCLSCLPPALNIAPVYLQYGDRGPVNPEWLKVLMSQLG